MNRTYPKSSASTSDSAACSCSGDQLASNPCSNFGQVMNNSRPCFKPSLQIRAGAGGKEDWIPNSTSAGANEKWCGREGRLTGCASAGGLANNEIHVIYNNNKVNDICNNNILYTIITKSIITKSMIHLLLYYLAPYMPYWGHIIIFCEHLKTKWFSVSSSNEHVWCVWCSRGIRWFVSMWHCWELTSILVMIPSMKWRYDCVSNGDSMRVDLWLHIWR